MITLKIGETHSIKLISNPSTGYCWYCEENKSKHYKVSQLILDKNSVNAKYQLTTEFKIKGIEKGKVNLIFHYKKEKNGQAAMTKNLSLEIK